jgi:hypothetical protein
MVVFDLQGELRRPRPGRDNPSRPARRRFLARPPRPTINPLRLNLCLHLMVFALHASSFAFLLASPMILVPGNLGWLVACLYTGASWP